VLPIAKRIGLVLSIKLSGRSEKVHPKRLAKLLLQRESTIVQRHAYGGSTPMMDAFTYAAILVRTARDVAPKAPLSHAPATDIGNAAR